MISSYFANKNILYLYDREEEENIKISTDIDVIKISSCNYMHPTEVIILTRDGNLYIANENGLRRIEDISGVTNIFNVKNLIFVIKDCDIYAIDLNDSNSAGSFGKKPVKCEFLIKCDHLISTIFYYRWTKNTFIIYASDDNNKCIKIEIPRCNIPSYNSYNFIIEGDNYIFNEYLGTNDSNNDIFYENFLKDRELFFINCIPKYIIIGYNNETICICNGDIIKLDKIIKCIQYNYFDKFMIAYCEDGYLYTYTDIQSKTYIERTKHPKIKCIDFNTGLYICENNNLYHDRLNRYTKLICKSMTGLIPNQKLYNQV